MVLLYNVASPGNVYNYLGEGTITLPREIANRINSPRHTYKHIDILQLLYHVQILMIIHLGVFLDTFKLG